MNDKQLDLLGGLPGAAREAPSESRAESVVWAKLAGPGRIGWAPASTPSSALAEATREGVVLMIGEDRGALEDLRKAGVAPRHVAWRDDLFCGAAWARHVEALAGDVRAGRRAAIVSSDPSRSAAAVATVAWMLGEPEAQAIARVGRRLDPAHAADVKAFAKARRLAAGGPSTDDSPIDRAIEDAVCEVDAIPPSPIATSSAREAPIEANQEIEVSPPERADAPIEATTTRVDAIETSIDPTSVVEALDRDRIATRVEAAADAEKSGISYAAIRLDPHGSRRAGAVLGAAIGDAMSLQGIDAERFDRGEASRRAEAVLDALLAIDGDASLDEVMRDLATRLGVPTTSVAVSGVPASYAYPFGLRFSADYLRAERWAVAASGVDASARAASAAMAVGVARLVSGESMNDAVSEMIAAALRHARSTAHAMLRALDEADERVPSDVVLARATGRTDDAIAATVYLACGLEDPPHALRTAATAPDRSIATLLGALLGAHDGITAWPDAWLDRLDRRDALVRIASVI